MVSFKDIKNINLDGFFKRKEPLSVLGRGVANDWKLIILSFAILLVGAMIFHVFFFYKINKLEVFSGGDSNIQQNVEVLNKKGIATTVNLFEVNGKRCEGAPVEPIKVDDPSR